MQTKTYPSNNRSIIALLVAFFCFCSSLFADILFKEDFDYPAGDLLAQSNWFGSTTFEVDSTGLTNSNFADVGGAAITVDQNFTNTWANLLRTVDVSQDDTLWVSILANSQANGMISFALGTPVFSSEFSIDIINSSLMVGFNLVQVLSPNTTYHLLARIDISASGDDTVYLWVDPDMSSEPSTGSAHQVLLDLSENITYARLIGNNGADCKIDTIYVTAEFSDITTITTPSFDFQYTNHGSYVEITGVDSGVTTLDIPAIVEGLPVTVIGGSAFYGNHDLTSVTLPDSLLRIESGAFGYMLGLTSITLPDSVTYIGHNAFASSDNITSLDLPESLESIGYEAPFAGASIEAFSIEANNAAFQTINGVLYSKDGKLLHAYPANKSGTTYTPLATVEEIRSSAFFKAQHLLHVSLPSGVKTIGNYAFYEARVLESLDLNDSLETIGDGVFRFTDALETITFPSTLVSIGDSAFYSSALKNVYFLGDAPTLGRQVFTHADSSLIINYDASASGFTTPIWEPYAGDVYNTRNNTQWRVSGNLRYLNHLTYIEIKELVSAATSVTVPSELDGLPVTHIGDRAFDNEFGTKAANLASVVLPDTIEVIGDSAFFMGDMLTTINLPDSLKRIEGAAFGGCFALANVTLPANLEFIGSNAFFGAGLTSINIPASTVSIGIGAFAGLHSLPAFNVDPANPNYTVVDDLLYTKDEKTLVAYPDGKAGTHYKIPAGTETIFSNAFSLVWSLTEVTVPSSVTSFGTGAFSSMQNLTALYFEGDAPTMAENAILLAHNDWFVYYYDNATGFTTPTWEPVSGDIYNTQVINQSVPVGSWLISHSLDLSLDITSDSNGDGISLLMEYALNLTPTANNASNVPAPTLNGSQLEFEFYALADGVTYTVEMTSDFITWTSTGVTVTTPDGSGMSTAFVDLTGTPCFLRLRVVQ